jgi:hypothetical protein
MAINPVLAPPGFRAALSSFGFSADRVCKCSFHAPATLVYSMQDSRHTDTRFVAPFSKRLSLSLMCQVAIVRPVEHLSSSRCPSHVTGFIAAIIVDSIKSMTRWAIPKFRKKTFERFKAQRNSDSPCAVAVIPVVTRIRTPRPHIAPRRIFGRAVHAMRGLQFYQSFPGYEGRNVSSKVQE